MASINAQIVRLAGPALAAGALLPLDELVQAALVGRLAGTTALAALGVCSSVFLLVFKVFNFLDTATTSRVARLRPGDNAAVSRALANAIFTAIFIGGTVALAMQLGSTWLLTRLGTRPALVTTCVPYLRTRALAAPLELVIMAAQGTLRGCRDMSTPAAANLLTFGVSNSVSYVLIQHFGLGLQGVALGRLVASACACALLLYRLAASGRLLWRHATVPPLATYREYARSAGALFVRTLLIKLFFTSCGVTAGALGTAAAAAHVIARQTASLFSILLDSCARILQLGTAFARVRLQC